MLKNRVVATAALAGLLLGCGPSCPEVKAGLDVTAAVTGDVTRINELVEKRKAAVTEAEQGGDSFQMQRLKFSVTAFEMAIGAQARIIKASPRFEDAPSYEAAAGPINEFRCFLDKLLAREGHTVSDSAGKTLRGHKIEIDRLLDRDGTVSPAELRDYYENGITVENREADGDDFEEKPNDNEDGEDNEDNEGEEPGQED